MKVLCNNIAKLNLLNGNCNPLLRLHHWISDNLIATYCVHLIFNVYNVFVQNFGVNISYLHQTSSIKEYVEVEYKRNYIVFQCTSEKESQLETKLLASGVVVSYENTQKMSQDAALKQDADENFHGHAAQAEVTLELDNTIDSRETKEISSTV